MVSTTITFSKADVQPPVFVAGSFTKWSPLEMQVKRSETPGPVENQFSFEIDLQPGEYQYKFRLGPGDWWVLDDASPSADDGSGNVNNILRVQPDGPKAPEPEQNNTAQIPFSVEDEVVSTLPSDLKGSQAATALSGKAPANVPANIGQKIVKDQGPKEVSERKSEKVNSHVDGHKEDSLPDIAPPPYSVTTETGAGLTPSSLKSESATLESTDGRNNARSDDIKGSSESKQSHESWTNRLCSRNVALLIAVLAVPVAVSFLWYR
ncbi:uncharacterized protein A1O9_04808 [Exophiala aquamarina CBS 119918]|uniref:AMP-activated protein kinase glycogen-binding domain-containing protein n=1 Tax=Exophiala aquamarina CBS 119918 TaxID=1182545 RepID=A0A072PWJ2_9EURO|nr:uncharacterized protein A1O9_04808 [Exophiala aquamarina CBS 119918]KEF59960.1 hypothetical protein A1O9_04808 [Exophiala aquamarina CBS 119918]